MSEELFKRAYQSVLDGHKDEALEIARESLDKGIDPLEMIEKGFAAGITEVGRLFDRGEVFLPELMVCAEAMKSAANILNEAAEEEVDGESKNIKVIIGTVQGDLHDIGKGIVASFLEANGMEVYDLGSDVSVEQFIEKAKEVDADVIGTSALLTSTMGEAEKLEKKLREENLRDKIVTIVGGAPATERWAKKIGADAYAENATQGVEKILQLVKK